MKKVITLAITAALVMCTAVSAFAVDFTPSVTNPGKPAIESTGTETPSHGEDENIIGQVTDGAGNVLSTEYAGCIWTASLEEALNENSDMSEDLRNYLKNLLKEFEEGKVDFSKIEGLEEIVGKNPVVRELFYAQTSCENLKELLPKDETFISMNFKIAFEEDDVFAVIVKIGDKWVLAEEAVNNGDGTVTVKLEDVGAIAFLVPGEEPVDTPVEEKAMSPLIIAIPAVGAGGAAAYFFGKKKKA